MPKKHSVWLLPLISIGADQVAAWSVDLEKKMRLLHCPAGLPGATHRAWNSNTVQLMYTLSRNGLLEKASAVMNSLSWTKLIVASSTTTFCDPVDGTLL